MSKPCGATKSAGVRPRTRVLLRFARNDGKGRGRRNRSPIGERRSVRGRGNAESATKASVERRQVSESARERDRQDRSRVAGKADSRPPHSRSQQVLVGRHSDRAAKNAKEVIFAHI